ncbi:MAG: hypothetical protein JWN70_6694 [Planctomycetaceae bacterium]|nr:hypothetical protein [Planctomycetaceae bacterium]
MFNNIHVPSRKRTDVWPRLLLATLICISMASGCAAARGRSDSSDTATQKQEADKKPKDNFFSGG